MDFSTVSETDVAYYLLSQNNQQPIYYKDLITEVIDKKNKPVQSLAAAISEIYTQINMDSRFFFVGEGMWGLSEWNPPEVKRGHGKTAKVGKPQNDDAESEPEEDEELDDEQD